MSGLLGLAFAAGMVAPVNPCGFALLPGWITLSLGDSHGMSLPRRLRRSIGAGLTLTLGFTGTLVAVGLIVSAGARVLVRTAPQIGFATGIIVLLIGLFSLSGRPVPLRLPRPLRASTRIGTGHSLAYGFGFAAASLSCTFGILLAVIAQAQATATVAGLLVVFGAYAAGAATVLLILALATAVLGTGLSKPAARLARHSTRITSLILTATGGYLAWYWLPAVNGASTTSRGPIASIAAQTATWIHNHTTLILLAAATALTVALLTITTNAVRRRGQR